MQLLFKFKSIKNKIWLSFHLCTFRVCFLCDGLPSVALSSLKSLASFCASASCILFLCSCYSNSEIILSLRWEERLRTDRLGDLNSPLGVLLVLFTTKTDKGSINRQHWVYAACFLENFPVLKGWRAEKAFFSPSRQVSVVANTFYKFFPYYYYLFKEHSYWIYHSCSMPWIQFMHCRQPDRQTIQKK